MKIRKLLIISIGIIFASSLTACSTGAKEFATGAFPAAIAARGQANIDLARAYKEMGALSDKTFLEVEENINHQVAIYKEATTEKASVLGDAVSAYKVLVDEQPEYIVFIDEDGTNYNLDLKDNVYKSSETKVSGIEVPNKPDNPDFDGYKNGYSGFIVSNYLYVTKFKSEGDYAKDNTWTKRKNYNNVNDRSVNSPIEPIQMVSEDVQEEINARLRAKVYILRSDIASLQSTDSMDGIFEMVKEATADPDNIDTAKLNNYFAPAISNEDENGDGIIDINDTLTLIDPEDDKYKVINTSKPNSDASRTQCGYDLLISQQDHNILSVRFTEFDQEAYDNIVELTGLAQNKYIFAHDNENAGEWRAYLMEYPVSAISTLESNSDSVDVEFAESGIGINLKTNQFVKFEGSGTSGWTSVSTPVDCIDPYLTTEVAENNTEIGKSSLILKGISKFTLKNTSEKALKYYCGRIILRDYLEATFAPSFNTNGENLAVFGRKMRLLMGEGEAGNWTEVPNYAGTRSNWDLAFDKDIDVAEFVDKDGNTIGSTPKLQITDFCDVVSLTNNDLSQCTMKSIVRKTESPETRDATFDSSNTSPSITELKRETVGDGVKINPSIMFPGPALGEVDYDTDTNSKQRFIALVTTKGLFDSKLFSDWINSTSTTASLDWWNSYLDTNNFSYKAEHEAVNNYITNNYAYELSQNGVVILDLDTIKFIQDEYNNASDNNTMGKLRTFFMILGWVLIIFVSLLLLSWAIDTNADIGIKLLEKITFGHWIAVKYEDDIPYNNANESQYMTFGKLLVRCLIIVVLGIILINVDIFSAVLALINLFGGAAEQIEKIILGLR